MSDVILVNVADRVATITLNRPEARNGLSRALLRTVPRAVQDADAGVDVIVLILPGADPGLGVGMHLTQRVSAVEHEGGIGRVWRAVAADRVGREQADVAQMVTTYDEGSLTTAAEWWDLESRVSREWMQSGARTGAEIERRREAIMARGRKQVG